MAEGIGFGRAPARTESWEKEVGGTTFVFTKTRQTAVFLYSCECKSIDRAALDFSTGFYSDADLSRDEIEARPQFTEFIAGHS